MKTKLILTLATMLSLVTGMRAATPYALYFESDQSFHFIAADTPPIEGGFHVINLDMKKITKVFEIDLNQGPKSPEWRRFTPEIFNCTKVVFESSFQNVRPTSCYGWFDSFTSMTTIENLRYLNTSEVTTMNTMFYACKSLTSLNLSAFNTSKVTDMYGMFSYCRLLTSLDISAFDTSNVTNMARMFDDCSGLTSLDVSRLNTSNVTTMWAMFQGCNNLTSLDVSNFNTEKVTSMAAMFSMGNAVKPTTKLSSIKFGQNFNTSNVEDISSMFYNCFALTSIDLSRFDTSNVNDMSYMFYNCNGLTSLDLTGFVTSNVTDMHEMFYYCSKLTSLNLDNFDTSNVTNMSYMFYNCYRLTSLDVSNFDTSNVKNMGYLFAYCSVLPSLDVKNFNTAKATNMTFMFAGCNALESIDLSNFDTSNVTNMRSMFNACTILTSLDLCSFNTSKVADMSNMFYNCTGLEKILVSENFVTTAVTNSTTMFTGCSGLRNFRSSSVTASKANYGPDGYLTFYGAYSIFDADTNTLTFKYATPEEESFYTMNKGDSAPGWSDNTSLRTVVFDESFAAARPTSCYGWFNGCSDLTSLEGLEYLNTSQVTNMSSMFSGCSSLTQLDLSTFDTGNVTEMTDMLAGSGVRVVDLSNATTDCSDFVNQIDETVLVYAPENTAVADDRANVVVGETCGHFVINGDTEAGQNLLSIPYGFTANKVTINRTMEKDTPVSLYMPFEMSATDYGTFYAYEGYDDECASFTPLPDEQTVTEPNTPYMFKPLDDYTAIEIDNGVKVEATPVVSEPDADGYIGVYDKKVFTQEEADSEKYYCWNGKEFKMAAAGDAVDAGQAYFKLPSTVTGTAPEFISAKLGDEITTGILDIRSELPEGMTPIYNLNGQPVSDSYRGIIIKNGKKILNNLPQANPIR